MTTSSPMIRAMANTLWDKSIDPLYKDDWEVASALVLAGWPLKNIDQHFDAVKMMAAIRFANEARKRQLRAYEALEHV